MNKPAPASSFAPGPDWDDNPTWTDDDFAKARPASEMLPPHIAAALTGKQVAFAKEEVTIELDEDVIAKFRATGRGWQTRINEALRAAKV